MKKFLPALSILFVLNASSQTFQKTITTGNTQFAASAATTMDGGYILAGDIYVTSTNSDMYIVKLDAKGNLLWDKSIGGTQYDHATKIIQTKDGGYAVAGNSGDNGGTYMRLVKLDADGNVQWSKYYSANKYNGATTVVQTPDNGYALGGYTQTYGNGSAGFLIKTDASGNVSWSKRIFDISFYPSIQAMVTTTDGGFAAVLNARTTNAYYDMYLVKLTGSGDFQWARSIGGESTDVPKFVLQTADKGYLFGGSSFSFSANQDMLVVKTDSLGNKKWSEKIATNQYDYATGAIELTEKLYVIAGVTQDSVSLSNQPYAVLLNQKGKLVNTQIVVSSASTVVNTVTRSVNGGFVVAGHDPLDVYIANFKVDGKICGDKRSAGVITDTGELITQTVPVKNLTPVVSTGAETAADQTGAVNTLCHALAPQSSSQSSVSGNALNVSVYPDPVKDKFLLRLNTGQQAMLQIEIISLNGKIMWKEAINVSGEARRNIDVQSWQKGVYYVRVRNGNEVRRISFLKE